MSEDELDAVGSEADAPAVDGGNLIVDLQSQLLELSKKHDEAMATMANLGNGSTRSYVYVPRERQIVPFSGDPVRDGRTVDEFIDEVERVIRARSQSPEDQVDFILSLLKGSALEEVRLCMGGESKQPSDLFSYLRGAFREKRNAPQLLHAFYARKQEEGEDLRDYSHALSQILSLVLKQSPDAVTNVKLTMRDQFIEGIRDSSLRRELRRFVREKPQSTFFDVREEALTWVLEEKPCNTAVAKSRNIASDSIGVDTQASSKNAPENSAVTLQDVIKVVAEQGKAISELTNAVRDLTLQKESPGSYKSGKPRATPRFTEDGQPICFKCRKAGHIARQCTEQYRATGQSTTTPSSGVQEN